MIIDNNSVGNLIKIIQPDVIAVYGIAEGMQVTSVIVPAFVRDFEGVIGKSFVGLTVTEEYMTEDKKLTARFEGVNTTENGKNVRIINAVIINGNKHLL